MNSERNLKTFFAAVDNAPFDGAAEAFVRDAVSRFALSCPVPVLIEAARVFAAAQRAELDADNRG